jgi:hypothetical protein
LRLRIHRDLEVGYSLCGTLWAPGFSAVSLEREWKANQAGASCVPAGFYYLEPHDGTKYKGTYALIGAEVSHEKTLGVPRYACVAHNAETGLDLQGCFAAGKAIRITPGKPGPGGKRCSDGLAVLEDPVVDKLLALLKASHERHYLSITEAYPITTRGRDRTGLEDPWRAPAE